MRKFSVLLAVIAACDSNSLAEPRDADARAPAIDLFQASVVTVCPSGAVTLTYRFSGGAGVITPGDLTATGDHVVVTLTETTTFTLTVTSEAGERETATVTVDVAPLPEATITAPASVPLASTGVTASVPAQEGVTYAWVVTTANASITSGADGAVVSFDVTGPGDLVTLDIDVTATATGCTAHGSADIAVTAPTTECGDGVLTDDEDCDDGDTDPLDGCDGNCLVEPGYACTGDAGGTSLCAWTCGNGVVDGDEQCDDNGLAPGDGCGSTCLVDTGYDCANDAGAASVCAPICGDALVVGAEECDDGGIAPGDGCDDVCHVELGYDCTDGAGAPASCHPVCGDGLVIGGEPCDDGDLDSEDGCDGDCHVEPGYDCSGEPSTCTVAPATERWSLAFGGEDGAAQPMAVATDSGRNVIVVGNFTGDITLGTDVLHNAATNDTKDIFVAKFSPTGDYVWSRRFGDTAASGFQNQRALAVAIDGNDDIVVTGDFATGASNSLDFGGGTSPLVSTGVAAYVAKLSGGNGAGLWAVQAGGIGVGDWGSGVTIDSADDVIVVGGFSSATFGFPSTLVAATTASNADAVGTYDVFVDKLAGASGDALWTQPKVYGSSGNQSAAAVALDRDVNNVDGFVITGTFVNALNFGGTTLSAGSSSHLFVAKLNEDGGHVFSVLFGGTVANTDSAYGVAVDSAGNSVVIGQFDGTIDFGNSHSVTTTGGFDVFVAKLDLVGLAMWAYSFGASASHDEGLGVAIDANDDVVCTGNVGGDADFGGGLIDASGANDAYLVKLSGAGEHVWSRLYGDAQYQFARGVAVDSLANVAATGYFRGQMDFGAGAIEPTGLGYGAYLGSVTP